MTLSIPNRLDDNPQTIIHTDYAMDDDAFYTFCRQNEHLKFERAGPSRRVNHRYAQHRWKNR